MSRVSKSTIRNVIHTEDETRIRFYRKGNIGKKPEFSHLASYKHTSKLDSGGFGVVYKGRISQEDRPNINDHPILIKKMGYIANSSPRSILDLPIEMQLEREIFEKRHGNYGESFLSYEFHEPDKQVDVYLQMPEIPGIPLTRAKDLYRSVLDQLLLTEEAIIVLRDFHSDINFSPRLAHHDVKPANMMFEKIAKHRFIIRLIDFGSCRPGNLKYTLLLGGSTLAYAAPSHYSDDSKDLFQSDAFSLKLSLLEVGGVDFSKFRCEMNRRLEREDELKIEEYILENEPEKDSSRYAQYKEDLETFKSELIINRMKIVTETEINYDGFLWEGLMNEELLPYINRVKEIFIRSTDFSSESNLGLDQFQLVVGEAVGATISYHLLRNMRTIEDDTYLDFSRNWFDCKRLLNILYSKPLHEYINRYSGRLLGANKYLKDHQRKYTQFDVSAFDFFQKEGARNTLNFFFKASMTAKLSLAIDSLIKDESLLEEQRLVLIDICKTKNEALISLFIERTKEFYPSQNDLEIHTKSDLIRLLLERFIENINRKLELQFELNLHEDDNNIIGFFEKMVNKTLGLYRANDIDEKKLVDTLKLLIVHEEADPDENIRRILMDTIRHLDSCCNLEFLKSALQKLKNKIEQMFPEFIYKRVYKTINKISNENRLDCEIFSRFSMLLLELGERPSNQLIEITCGEFQMQCQSLINRNTLSRSRGTLLASRGHRRVSPETRSFSSESNHGSPCCCVVS